MKPLVAFDLDGTLLDCRRRQVALTQWLLEKHGAAPLDAIGFWKLKRNGASTEQAISALYRDPLLASTVACEWKELVEQPEWLSLDIPLPDVHASLNRLREHGVQMGLLTARSNRDGLVDTMSRCGLSDYFSVVTMVDPIKASYSKSTVLLNWQPIVFLGDTESDMRAAAHAGIPFIALTCGQRSKEWLLSQGANSCFSDIHSAIRHSPRFDFVSSYAYTLQPSGEQG